MTDRGISAGIKVYVRIPAFTIDQAILAGKNDGTPVLPYLDFATLKAEILRLDRLGAHGALISDHLFVSHGRPRAEAAAPCDPLTVLAAVGAISPRLTLGTIVANLGINEPALTFRQFAQLAQLYGGGRVLAGVGAGWNPEEFDALGRTMPRYRDRMGRLEEALMIGRALFDDHVANLEGDYLTARDLPLAPVPHTAPRLMVGGGSDTLLRLAGTYADAVDLNASSNRAPLRGGQPHNVDTQRRATTTTADLVRSTEKVRDAAVAAGRQPDAVVFSILLNLVHFGPAAEVEEWERGICAEAAIPHQPLADSPYAMAGNPKDVADRIAERIERLGLSAVIVNAGPELDVFMNEVMPNL